MRNSTMSFEKGKSSRDARPETHRQVDRKRRSEIKTQLLRWYPDRTSMCTQLNWPQQIADARTQCPDLIEDYGQRRSPSRLSCQTGTIEVMTYDQQPLRIA